MDDFSGKIRGYVGNGGFANDPLKMFARVASVEVQQMQELLRTIRKKDFEPQFRRIRG
jgi:hypothetical protein